VIDPGQENIEKLPLSYAVRRRLALPSEAVLEAMENDCVVRRLKAILSWNAPPPGGICRESDPMRKIYWGDVKTCWIRLHR
jgi:hypothetical protein